MEILKHNERELLKKEAYAAGDCEGVDRAKWHRFREQLYGEGAVAPADCPEFTEYQVMLRDYPGWSYGFMHPGHSAWRPEYFRRDLPMNLAIIRIIGPKQARKWFPNGWLDKWLKAKDQSIARG